LHPERTLPVWSFGYAGFLEPARVERYDGSLVARTGESVSLGGGWVPIDGVPDSKRCGASRRFIVANN
jgi:hypothetical protein